MMGAITGSSLLNSALGMANGINADSNSLNGLAQRQIDNEIKKADRAVKSARVIYVEDIKAGSSLSELTPDELKAQGYTVMSRQTGQVLAAPKEQQTMVSGGGATNFLMSPTQSWAGAGAVPQYGMMNGGLQPYVNYLDQTQGMGMFFPPTANINQGYPMMAGGNSMLNSIDAQIMMLQTQRAMYAGGGDMMGGMLPSSGAGATPVGKRTLQDLKVNGTASTAGAGGMTPQQQQQMMMMSMGGMNMGGMGIYSSPLMQNVGLPQFTPTATTSATPDLASIMALLQESGVDLSTLGTGAATTTATTSTTTADTTTLTYINTPVTDTTVTDTTAA
ncbi:MAG: hypothetical protein HEQ32_08125 [Vampirovibrio sp.]